MEQKRKRFMKNYCDCNNIGNIFYVAVPILKPYPAQGVDDSLQDDILKEIENLEDAFFVDEVKIEYKSVKNIEPYKHCCDSFVFGYLCLLACLRFGYLL